MLGNIRGIKIIFLFAIFRKNVIISLFNWPHRLTVRTPGFQSDNQSSILCGVTKTRIRKDWTAPVLLRFCEDGSIFFSKKIAESGAGKFPFDGKEIIVAHTTKSTRISGAFCFIILA